MQRVQLFGGVPDVMRVADAIGVDPASAHRVLAEFEFICKTITRLGRGYVLGESGFSRPDTDADRAMASATEDPDEVIRQWIFADELAEVLADRAELPLDMANAFVTEVAEQLQQHGSQDLTVATRDVELEAAVERELLADLAVLAIWGWELSEVVSQKALGAGNRADIVGRDPDGNWVVIELKRYAAVEETGHQIRRYLDAANELLATGSESVQGLVIADGDDREFHETVSDLPVTYLPVRRLALPACRPQCHIFNDGSGAVWVAADGRTVVRAEPDLATFTNAGPAALPHLWPTKEDRPHRTLPVAQALAIID